MRRAWTYLFTTVLIDLRENLEDGFSSILDAFTTFSNRRESIFFLFTFNSHLVPCSSGSTSWCSGSHRLKEGGILALVFVRILLEGEWQVLVPNIGVSNLLVALNLVFVFLARLFDLVFHTIKCLGITGIDFLFGVFLLCSRERCIETEECFNPVGWDRFRDVRPFLDQACQLVILCAVKSA